MPSSVGPPEVLRIAADFYSVPEGARSWAEALASYGTHFPNVRLALIGYEKRLENADLLAHANFDESFVKSYLDYYHRLNPWDELLEKAPRAPCVLWGHDCVPLESLTKTEFYADWVKPQDNIATGFASTLFREKDRFVVLATNVSLARLEEGRAAADAFKVLGPHLRRAFELWRRLEFQPLNRSGLETTLDNLASAVFLVDENRRVLFENRRARELCRKAELVGISPSRFLIFRPNENEKAVAVHLAEIKNSHARAPLMIGLWSDKGLDSRLIVSPIFQEPRDPFGRAKPPALYLLFLVDLRTEPESAPDAMSKLLGITATETLLAIALMAGKTIAEYAEERAVSVHTARAQLRSLLHKTNSKRQSDVVNLLARTFGTFRI